MKSKLVLSLIVLALVCACSSIATYDETSFPPQVVWNDTANHDGVTYPATDRPGE